MEWSVCFFFFVSMRLSRCVVERGCDYALVWCRVLRRRPRRRPRRRAVMRRAGRAGRGPPRPLTRCCRNSSRSDRRRDPLASPLTFAFITFSLFRLDDRIHRFHRNERRRTKLRFTWYLCGCKSHYRGTNYITRIYKRLFCSIVVLVIFSSCKNCFVDILFLKLWLGSLKIM